MAEADALDALEAFCSPQMPMPNVIFNLRMLVVTCCNQQDPSCFLDMVTSLSNVHITCTRSISNLEYSGYLLDELLSRLQVRDACV